MWWKRGRFVFVFFYVYQRFVFKMGRGGGVLFLCGSFDICVVQNRFLWGARRPIRWVKVQLVILLIKRREKALYCTCSIHVEREVSFILDNTIEGINRKRIVDEKKEFISQAHAHSSIVIPHPQPTTNKWPSTKCVGRLKKLLYNQIIYKLQWRVFITRDASQ